MAYIRSNVNALTRTFLQILFLNQNLQLLSSSTDKRNLVTNYFLNLHSLFHGTDLIFTLMTLTNYDYTIIFSSFFNDFRSTSGLKNRNDFFQPNKNACFA